MSSDNTPEFLKDALKFGINLGLERMEMLDKLLGNPEENLQVIHLAGTNGKGSTAAYISSIMAASGKKVGVYTSPFLERFSERIRIIDGKDGLLQLEKDETVGEIPLEDLDRLSSIVEEASKKMDDMGCEHPTEFELVTAIAYLWFKEQQVDIAVLETGLGGRLDSTNVIKNPLCTVITAMGLDHTDRLGATIDLIAKEKAGIFKNECPAVVYEPYEMILDEDYQRVVKNVFTECAIEKNVPLQFVRAGNKKPVYTEDGKMQFYIDGDETLYMTRLLGDHQKHNAAVAIACARSIDGVTQDDIVFGIEHANWKGRAECLALSPVVVMDGGHNSQGAQSLSLVLNDALAGTLKDVNWRVVMGVMKDKDVSEMINKLHEGGVKFSDVRCVRVSNSRTMDPEELSDKIKLVYNNLVKISSYEDACEAVVAAYNDSVNDGMPLLITGSLYLVGEVRGVLKAQIRDEE